MPRGGQEIQFFTIVSPILRIALWRKKVVFVEWMDNNYSQKYVFQDKICCHIGNPEGSGKLESHLRVFLHCVCVYTACAQSYPTLCEPMNCSPPGSSVHGIFQARIWEWLAISFSRGSSRWGAEHASSALAGGFFSLCHLVSLFLHYIILHKYLRVII